MVKITQFELENVKLKKEERKLTVPPIDPAKYSFQ